MKTQRLLKAALLIHSLPWVAYSQMEIPEPVTLSGSLVSFSVPDLHQTIEILQGYADRIMPENESIQLKAQIGGMLGDPELSFIPEGGGAAVVWDGVTWYAVVQCDPESQTLDNLSPLTKSLQVQSLVQDRLLILSKTQPGLDQGKNQATACAAALLKSDQAGGVVRMQTAKLIERFRPQINMGIAMLPAMMMKGSPAVPEGQKNPMQNMGRILEGEMRILVSIFSQIDSLDLSIIPRADSLEYQYLFSAKKDTRLHTLITAPDVLTPDPAISVAYLEPGMMALEMFVGNPEALATFLKGETEQLAQEMFLDPEVTENWITMMELWTDFFSGSVAETIQLDPESGFSLGYIGSVTNEEAMVSSLETISELMEPIMGFYEDMGIPMKMDLQLNSREYKGTAVHQYDFSYELDNMDPQMAEQFQVLQMSQMDSELALKNNRILWTMGTQSLDKLLDRMDSGNALGTSMYAHSIYPEGALYYFDLDMSAYMDFIVSYMPDEAAFDIFNTLSEGLQDSPPLSGATFKQDNRVLMSIRLPFEFIEMIATMGFNGQSLSEESATKPRSKN